MRVSTERILQEASQLRVTIGDMRRHVSSSARGVTERRYNVSESEEPTVNGNTLFDALTSGSCPFKLKKEGKRKNVSGSIECLKPPKT